MESKKNPLIIKCYFRFCSGGFEMKNRLISFAIFFLLQEYTAFLLRNAPPRANIVSWQLSTKNPFDADTSDIPTTTEHSELPESFEDAVRRAALRSIDVINSGKKRIRIDFDTSIGDQTYTTLKNSIPVMKLLSNVLSQSLDLYPLEMMIRADVNANETEANSISPMPADLSILQNAVQEEERPKRTMRIFFPDMGAAVLARRDWKMGT